MKSLEYANSYKQKVDKELPGAEGREELQVTANGEGVSRWGDGSVLESDSGDGCTTLWTR